MDIIINNDEYDDEEELIYLTFLEEHIRMNTILISLFYYLKFFVNIYKKRQSKAKQII